MLDGLLQHKRDDCSACDTNYDFTKTIFDAYLEGRTLITNQADLSDILVQRDIVMNNWEKVVLQFQFIM